MDLGDELMIAAMVRDYYLHLDIIGCAIRIPGDKPDQYNGFRLKICTGY